MAYKYKDNYALDDIKEKHKKDDLTKYTPHYDNISNPIDKGNHVWDKDLLRSGVERFFLLKNDIIRQIMESYGEYVGDIDYDKNVKIRYKSEIKDDKEDWNANFTQAFINNFGSVALNGEFTIPAVITDYIKNVCIPNYHTAWKYMCLAPQYVNRFEEAQKRVEMCVKGGINEYVALATVGCMYNEDGWAAKSSGNYGISKLPNELQFKCCYDYWEHECGASGKFIINSGKPGMDFKNPVNQMIACIAAYVSKAGMAGWKPGNWMAGLDRRCKAYFNLNKYE